MDSSDRIARAYSRLRALRKNTPDQYYVDEEYVRQYHESLQHLAEVGFDIAEFEIPDDWIKRRVASSGPRGIRYRKVREAVRSKFLSKLDAVLEYFAFTISPVSDKTPREEIGFTGRKKI